LAQWVKDAPVKLLSCIVSQLGHTGEVWFTVFTPIHNKVQLRHTWPGLFLRFGLRDHQQILWSRIFLAKHSIIPKRIVYYYDNLFFDRKTYNFDFLTCQFPVFAIETWNTKHIIKIKPVV